LVVLNPGPNNNFAITHHANLDNIIMNTLCHSIRLAVVLLFLVFAANAQSESTIVDTNTLQVSFQQILKEYQLFQTEHGHYIQTPNVNLHYLTWGKPTDQPIVWVHGTTSNAYEAEIFADRLVREGYYVIAIDYYGHGRTPFPQKEVSIYNVVDDIRFLLKELNIKKTIIGGWSRGGTIASAFYDTYPDMVSAIVLEDGGSVGWLRPYYRMGHDKWQKIFDAEFAKHGPIPDDEFFPSLFDAYCALQSEGKLGLSTLHAINQSENGEWAVNPGLLKWLGEDSRDQLVKLITRPTEAPLFEFSTMILEPKIVYRNLRVPILIFDPVWEDDLLKDFQQDNALLKSRHPDLITHLVYVNTGHAVKFQHPERFCDDLISFLKIINEAGIDLKR
jgi:pimeloyl-ACP methyl ester carboxylesterase